MYIELAAILREIKTAKMKNKSVKRLVIGINKDIFQVRLQIFLAGKRDQDKMRDYLDRRVTSPTSM